MKGIDKKKKKWWTILIGLVVGMICGTLIVLYSDKNLEFAYSCIKISVLYIGICVAVFFHVIVHEAGHLVFGLLTGYEFTSFRVASFIWFKENGKLKLKRYSLAGTQGQCLMSPPDMKDGKMPFVLYNIGGVLFNVILGALFLIGYLLCLDIPLLAEFFSLFAMVGFMFAVENGIPMRFGNIVSDGYNTWALSRSKEALEAFWVQLKVNEQYAKGVSIKDMPAEWFVMPKDENIKNNIMVATRGVLTYNRLMCEQRIEEANDVMERLLEIDGGILEVHRGSLMCNKIYYELIGENRSDVVESMMTKKQKKYMKAMKNHPSVLGLQYVLALLFEKDVAKAETIKNEFEKTAKTHPYSQDIESVRNCMKTAEEKSAA